MILKKIYYIKTKKVVTKKYIIKLKKRQFIYEDRIKETKKTEKI